LARVKYLKDVKNSLPRPVSASSPQAGEEELDDDQPPRTPQKPKTGWLDYFSVESMGLADYVDKPTTSAGTFISGLIPKIFGSTPTSPQTDDELFDQEDEQAKAEAERLFLTYSWWLLHEGWRGIADRVDEAVERVFST
jgi:peroxin-3